MSRNRHVRPRARRTGRRPLQDRRPGASWSSITTALALWVLAAVLDGFDIDSAGDALLAGLVVGLRQRRGVAAAGVRRRARSRCSRWASARSCSTRCSCCSCSTGCPASTLDGFWTAARDRDRAGRHHRDRVVAAGARRRRLVRPAHGHASPGGGRRRAAAPTCPGIVFVQLDGLAEDVLRRALRSGDVPDARPLAARRLAPPGRLGDRVVVADRRQPVRDPPRLGRRTCRRSAGSTRRPAQVVVSNRPKSAAAIERAHSDGHGLLAHHGSSYGNLFSGDAERAVLTMSGIARRKEGRFGAGYVGYFSRPQQATRTLIGLVRRRRPRAPGRASCSVRRGVEPRVAAELDATPCCGRSRPSSAATCRCRACSTTSPRAGRRSTSTCSATTRCPTTPVPSAPTPSPCCATSTARSAASTASLQWAPRPYHLVVLSDHGQTQGAPFHELAGETLAELVGRLCGGGRVGRPATPSRASTESTRVAAPGPGRRDGDDEANGARRADRARFGQPRAGVRCPGCPAGLLRDEIDERYPALIHGLRRRTPTSGSCSSAAEGGSLVLGASGERNLATGEVTGDDPLAPFGPRAVEQVAPGRRLPRRWPT